MTSPPTARVLELAAKVRAAALEQVECAIHPTQQFEAALAHAKLATRLFSIAKSLTNTEKD